MDATFPETPRALGAKCLSSVIAVAQRHEGVVALDGCAGETDAAFALQFEVIEEQAAVLVRQVRRPTFAAQDAAADLGIRRRRKFVDGAGLVVSDEVFTERVRVELRTVGDEGVLEAVPAPALVPLASRRIVDPRLALRRKREHVELMAFAFVAPRNRIGDPAIISVGLNELLDRRIADRVGRVAVHPIDAPGPLRAPSEPRHRAAEPAEREPRGDPNLEEGARALGKREGRVAGIEPDLASLSPEEVNLSTRDQHRNPGV